MNMAVSLVPSVRYGNCRHFCPYLRPRCVWFFDEHACTHARTHARYARTYFANWLLPLPSSPPHRSAFPHRLSSARVVRASVPRGSLISGNFVKRAPRINRAGTPRRAPLFSTPFLSLPSPLPPSPEACALLAAPFGHRGRCEDTEKSDLADYLLARWSRHVQRVQNSIGIRKERFFRKSFVNGL